MMFMEGSRSGLGICHIFADSIAFKMTGVGWSQNCVFLLDAVN